MTMFIERVITFVVLGFFVFVADVGSWWHHGDLGRWYGNYLTWIGLIVFCYIASSRLNTHRNSFSRGTHPERRKTRRESRPHSRWGD
jgi:hypothetical protein